MDALSPTTIQNLIQVYGLWVLFPVVMLERMGIPVPGETALVTTAVYAGGVNRMRWRYFFLMNAIGGFCWASLFGGVAYLFGEEVTRVTGPVRFLLLVGALALVVAGILFFRHHERELEQRADAALRGM